MKFIEVLQADFPNFSFVEDEENLWLPGKNTIYYRPGDKAGALHELGHATLQHKNFIQDIELLHAERDAWDKALELGAKYGVKISEKRVETAMDWYRDWLHARSTCPKCGQNAPQERATGRYKCFNCGAAWNANDGRNARIHRYMQK
jgi:ribosomal protein L37AE/L43A